MFSRRTPRSLAPNEFSLAVEQRRLSGARLIDLTETNPTRAGIDYPWERIGAALGRPDRLRYDPDPRGIPSARDAVAGYYAERGIEVTADRVVLTSSSSEAYALLFKLLADPGDEILVPAPSYPLFEHLARVECVQPVTYHLTWDGVWRIDLEMLRGRCTERTRAVVIVSPNNPTGSTLKRDELAEIFRICREREMAIICDEVFADYVRIEHPERVKTVAGSGEVLTFALNGLSKAGGLPQVKLGWIIANGPDGVLKEALERLEFLADLFLSVGTPVQQALPELLDVSAEVAGRIRERVGLNLETLVEVIGSESSCSVIPAEGGWSALVRIPRVVAEERVVLDLIEERDVVVQPGYFFDMEIDGVLVVSLLPEPEEFAEGMRRFVDYIDRIASG